MSSPDGEIRLCLAQSLIPARKTEHQYKKALKKGQREVDRLKDARKQGKLDEENASSALTAVEKGIAEQDALKREALKAKDEGKEYAAKMKIKDLKRKLKLQEERDRRREDIVKEQVAALAKENQELHARDSKISMQMEEVPANGAHEGNLMALRNEIKNLQRSESEHVDALEDEVRSMKEQMDRLRSGVERQPPREDGLRRAVEPEQRAAVGAEGSQAEMSSKQLLELARQESEQEEAAREEAAGREADDESDDEDDEDQLQEEEDKKAMQADSAQDAEAMYSEQSEDSEYSSDGDEDGNDNGCVPCDTGAECYAGCKSVSPQERAKLRQRELQKDVRDNVKPVKDHQLALFNPHPKGYNIVPMGADGVMPKGEEFGSNIKHCRSGHCEPLEDEGVKVDGWGFGQSDKSLKGFYRMLPFPHLDPSAENSVVRAMNQRKGRFAQYNKAGQPGVFTPGSSWGANSKFFAHDRSPGAKKLEAKGVSQPPLRRSINLRSCLMPAGLWLVHAPVPPLMQGALFLTGCPLGTGAHRQMAGQHLQRHGAPWLRQKQLGPRKGSLCGLCARQRRPACAFVQHRRGAQHESQGQGLRLLRRGVTSVYVVLHTGA